jgi:cytochrome P450
MWMLWFVLQDDDVRARLVAEIDSCFRGSTLEVDILRLAALPLLNSVYMETLRLRAASPVGRTPVSGNYRFGRWRFRKDVPIIATSWLGGYDADFWNQGAVLPGGGGRPSHPVDDFWADRFLEHPDDPASGPIRRRGGLKETAARTTITADGVAAEKPGLAKRNTNTYADSDSTQHSQPRLVTSGMAGHWFPFGGGQNTCPGRFFAKQEVLAGAAVMLRAFEFDIADRPAWAAVAPNMAYFPFGVVPPKGKSPIRIRKRTLP